MQDSKNNFEKIKVKNNENGIPKLKANSKGRLCVCCALGGFKMLGRN